MNAKLTMEEVDALLEGALAEHYTFVGRIASIWAMLELRMDQLIWDLMDVEQLLGACVTAQLSGPTPRIRVLKTLLELREWPAEILTELNKLGRKIVPLQEARNRAVHDAWFVGSETKRVYKQSVAVVDNKLIFSENQPTLDDLNKTFRESKKVLEAFNVLQEEIRSSPPSASAKILVKLKGRGGPANEGRLFLNKTYSKTPAPLKS